MLAKAIGEGRRLISDLRPMIIDEEGLIEAINYLVAEETGKGRVGDQLHARRDLRAAARR